MTRIRVTPEELFRAAQQMTAIGAGIIQTVSDLGSVLNGPFSSEYRDQLTGKVAAYVNSAKNAASGPGNKTSTHAASLNERGQAFATADSMSISDKVVAFVRNNPDWRDWALPHPVTNTNREYPVDPRWKNTKHVPSRGYYDSIINQFDVEKNPRYAQVYIDGKLDKTWCNIFVSDVTSAMGVEIPHWVDKDGKAVRYTGTAEKGWEELDVAKMRKWLESEEGRKTWRKVSAKEAQEMANRGVPSAVLNTSGTHIAIVRPGEVDPIKGPAIAQAGATNLENAHVLDRDGFGTTDSADLEYYVADAPYLNPPIPRAPWD